MSTLAIKATSSSMRDVERRRPSLLLRTMRAVPAAQEASFKVWLGKDPRHMGLTSSVQGLAYAYATYDDLSKYRLLVGPKASRVVIEGDAAIREWCRDNIPELVERACMLAAEDDFTPRARLREADATRTARTPVSSSDADRGNDAR